MIRYSLIFVFITLISISCDKKETTPRSLQFLSPVGRTQITLQDTMYIEVFADGHCAGTHYTLYNIRENIIFEFDETPFYIAWHPKMDGHHGFFAKAEYPDGEILTSDTVEIDVESYAGRIKIQGDNSHYIQAGKETVVYIESNLVYPVINAVEFYLDSILIASDSVFPFSIHHTFTQAGKFELGATLATAEGYPILLSRKINVFEGQ